MMAFSRLTLRRGLDRFAGLMLAGFLLAACSAEESLPQVDVDSVPVADDTRAGTLLAEYASPRSTEIGGVRVHAQFLDVHGINYARALEALEVWSPDFQLDLDACSMHSAQAVDHERVDDIRLELLNVGPITVRGPSEAIRLEARRLPDLLSTFSGVIYGTEQGFGAQPLRIAYQPGARYSFSAPGKTASGGFYVTMQAPRPIRIVSIGDRPAHDGSRFGWNFEHDLRVQWRPFLDAALGDGAALRGDDVFLRISSGFGPDRPRLNCRLDDDGAFTLPATLLEQLAGDSADLQLSLRRVNTREVDINGLDSAEFVFSTVDEITLVDPRP
jgi:hypothetical protein